MNSRMRLVTVVLSSLFVVPFLMIAAQQDPTDPLRSSASLPPGSTAPPAGFNNQTNGYISQTQYDAFKDTFDETETIEDGLGPTFNDTGCGNCHNIPVSGGSGLQLETRAGKLVNGQFTDHAGGSLV